MHENAKLIDKLFRSLQMKDHQAMADCYHPDATFRDIAFKLSGKVSIHAMWHMICDSDLCLSYAVDRADERIGLAHWSADYTYTDTDNKVHNELISRFTFRGGLIVEQIDESDARKWSMQALGPLKGTFAWLSSGLRRKTASAKLERFINEHPQYR